NISHDLRGVAGGSSAAGEENVYPVTVRRVGADNLLHYTWMSDDDPGTALQPAGTPRPVHMSRIMYDALDLTPGVIPFRLGPAGSGEERQEVLAAVLAPNPATEVAELRLELARAGEVTVTLRDVMGRVVTRPVTRQFGAGSQRLVLPVQPLGPGVYLCEVRGAGGSVVRRLVRQ
ncbi:MAG TPA: T9SS type A sorting domain-containing protein, partial [bacterium]|nr:T9SS type A sorting domain-containing protein [bacterium]